MHNVEEAKDMLRTRWGEKYHRIEPGTEDPKGQGTNQLMKNLSVLTSPRYASVQIVSSIEHISLDLMTSLCGLALEM